ncbi:STAS domain-containing protein [Embleya hyalina]|uniref:Anti-sigma factor antagonist n=1 Tax=Embleya hyalina TaxID=516124 RepID=A0A401YYK2_9ACTN|nr:STAS domain-containing protein [Embleya hyalina]GCD99671.1 anti-sigma-B factor antagonist [Embleya hyalina]
MSAREHDEPVPTVVDELPPARGDDPDPVKDFANWLCLVRLHGGDPSYDEIRRRCKRAGVDIPKSTLGDGLTGRRLLSRERAIAVVRACGGGQGLLAECRNRWTNAKAGQITRTPAEGGPDIGLRDAEPIDIPLGAHHRRAGVSCSIIQHGAWQVVRFSGDWDGHVMPAVRPHLESVVADTHHPHVVVDLSDVTFMDSSLLGGLVYVLQTMRLRGAVLRLVSGMGEGNLTRMGKVMIVTGLNQILPVYPTLEVALSPLSALDADTAPVQEASHAPTPTVVRGTVVPPSRSPLAGREETPA